MVLTVRVLTEAVPLTCRLGHILLSGLYNMRLGIGLALHADGGGYTYWLGLCLKPPGPPVPRVLSLARKERGGSNLQRDNNHKLQTLYRLPVSTAEGKSSVATCQGTTIIRCRTFADYL